MQSRIAILAIALSTNVAESLEPAVELETANQRPVADCAARAVHRILGFYGKHGDDHRNFIDLIQELNGTDLHSNVRFPRLKAPLNRRGLNCEFRHLNQEFLRAMDRPCIVIVNGNHYAVLERREQVYQLRLDDVHTIEETIDSIMIKCSPILLDVWGQNEQSLRETFENALLAAAIALATVLLYRKTAFTHREISRMVTKSP